MISESLKPDPKFIDALGEDLARRTIRKLQSLPAGLLADAGARNLWDEICVQTRSEHPFAEAYCDEIIRHLVALVAGLADPERAGIWLQTYAAEALVHDDESHGLNAILAAVNDNDIARYLLDEHLTYEMWNYTNAWIRDATGE